jgi:hypothetical protein
LQRRLRLHDEWQRLELLLLVPMVLVEVVEEQLMLVVEVVVELVQLVPKN